MRIRLFFVVLGMSLGGCVVKFTPPNGPEAHVIIGPFEKARVKSIARQFFLAYMSDAQEKPNALSAADFKCVDATLSEDLSDWQVQFSYSKDPINVIVKVSRDLKSACVFEEHEAPDGDRPAIHGDGGHQIKRTLGVFRWMLAEQRKQGGR